MDTYSNHVITQNEAICHLLFHCCFKDGRFASSEIDRVAEILVQFDLQKELNFKDEVVKYRSYADTITDEHAYVKYLIGLIGTANELALFSWCLELTLIDDVLSMEEEQLLDTIADALDVTQEERETVAKLMIQRSVAISEKIY